MLKRANRLPFFVRLSYGSVLRSSFCTVKYKKTTYPTSRVSVVVSKRVSSKAVVRNRIKRLMHTYLRTLLPTLPSSYDMLIIMHPGAITLDTASFLKASEELFSPLSG